MSIGPLLPETLWPSGLRRWLKAPVRKGVGSNPTGVIATMLESATQYPNFPILRHALSTII